jgi:hypothetical protein
MNSLTYTDRDVAAIGAADAKPAGKAFWTRLVRAIVNSQQRRAEREIARYLAGRGPLTDQVEREIMRRLSGAKPL